MASDFGVWAMREAGRNEYTVGRNEYEKRGAFIVTRYLSQRGAHLSQRGIYCDAARNYCDAVFIATRHATSLQRRRTTRTPQRQWRGIRAHGGDGRGNLRVAKTPPLQSALRGFIAPNRVDHPGVSVGGTPTATSIGKGGIPKRGVINARCYECATRSASIAMRYLSRRGTPRRYEGRCALHRPYHPTRIGVKIA